MLLEIDIQRLKSQVQLSCRPDLSGPRFRRLPGYSSETNSRVTTHFCFKLHRPFHGTAALAFKQPDEPAAAIWSLRLHPSAIL
jgi:hypothetical protein